jgi:Bacterial PH domain
MASESPREAAPPRGRRFACTSGGEVARGRRRLGRLLGGLALGMVGVAAASFASGRVGAGLIALAAAAAPLAAWLLAGGSQVEYLELSDGELGDGELAVGTRTGTETVGLAGASARRLSGEEIAHLASLATTGGVVAGTGSFDSHRLGEFDLAASDLRNAVLVEVPERRLVVTPDEPDEFVRRLAASAGAGAARAAGTIPPP